jgi:hypothetical protein
VTQLRLVERAQKSNGRVLLLLYGSCGSCPILWKKGLARQEKIAATGLDPPALADRI